MQAPSQASAGDLHLQFGQFSIGSNDFGSGFSSAFEPSHEPQGSEPASHSAVHSHQAVNPSAVDAFNAGGAGSNAYQTGSARDYSAFAQAPIQPSASKAPAAASAAGAAGPALQQQQAQHDAAASQQYYSNMPSSSAFQGSYGQSFGQHFQTPASQAYTSQQYQQYGADSSAGDSHSVAPVPSAAAAHKAYDNTSYGSYGQSTHQAPHQGHQASHQGMQSHQPASMHQASSAGHPGSALKAPATDYSGPGKYGNQSAAHAPSPVGALPASSGALGVSAASAAPPQPPVPQVPGFANPSGIPPSYAYAPYNFPYMAAASPYQYMQQGAAYQPYPPQNTAYAGQGAAFQQAGTSSYQGHGGAGGHQGTKYQPYNTQGYGASSNGYDEPVGGYGKPEKDSSSLYGGPRGQMHQGYQGRGQHAHAGHSSQHASHVQHGQHAQHSQQAQDTGYGYGQQTGYQSYQQQGYGGQGQYGGYGAQQYGIPYGQTPQGGPANGQAANTFKLQ
ncbi:hypothetical protein WJX72_010599 [[Myrmecia] bisecta]|uniref:Uncharacterized protein n=1 Tax=[Myrmecia] bisecta TaxID=41462 RepID=A0AAW1QAV8_9CHLO